MERAKKEQLVADLSGTFGEAAVIVITHQSGLTVAESTDLRRRMLAAGASYKVTKNRLAKLALAGTPYEGLVDLFEGPTAIAWSSDWPASTQTSIMSSASGKPFVISSCRDCCRLVTQYFGSM